jgi:phosphoribosylcarboxyaminoimidazole (NCAIR) mutase
VATVAIGGAENAGLLAGQILAGSHPEIAKNIKRYRAAQTKRVVNSPEAKGAGLGNLGVDEMSRRP